jgi:hypothetical protein
MDTIINILQKENEMMILNIEAHISMIKQLKLKMNDNTTKLSTLIGANKDIIDDEIGYLKLKMIEINILLEKIREIVIKNEKTNN